MIEGAAELHFTKKANGLFDTTIGIFCSILNLFIL